MDLQKPAESASKPMLQGRHLRTASLILPSTGQRVRRDFTLRDSALFNAPANSTQSHNETTPLLPTNANSTASPSTPSPPLQQYFNHITAGFSDYLKDIATFWQSDVGHGVLKCSLAYFVATLATFSPLMASILGTQVDGNPLVANVVVWFDPYRTAGGMELAVLLALLAFVYGVAIAFASMGTSIFFADHDLLVVGHVIVVVVFCGGGLGLLAWVKQYFNHPVLNTATSVASLAIVTILTKEGVVQTGDFSLYRVTQILKMLIMGIIISTIVDLVVWPVSARRQLRESLTKSTNAFGDLLALTTSSFLTGLEEDMNHPVVIAAQDRFKSVFSSLPKYLAEARYEQLLLGFEKRYHIEKRLVKCLQQLAQDLSGLRSAAAMQFALLSEKNPRAPSDPSVTLDTATLMLASVEDPPDRSDKQEQSPVGQGTKLTQGSSPSQVPPEIKPSEVFDKFIAQLGPPMKSLAYTLREILNNLPYQPELSRGPDHHIFKGSLIDAISLFNTSRREALTFVYKSKEMTDTQALPVAADFEEVAASCGQFTSSLQDFAETCVKYMDILDELQVELRERRAGLSWNWILFWRKNENDEDEGNIKVKSLQFHPDTAAQSSSEQLMSTKQILSDQSSPTDVSKKFPYMLYPYIRVWRRDDIRWAIKVGLGAAFYGSLAFIPATRPIYEKWHLDWALTAYMLVCAMTVGASNTTGMSRLQGTLIGGATGVTVWLLCFENPWALAFMGWFVSVICYYWIYPKDSAPMGRFILLTYNLSILSTYALGLNDPGVHEGDPGQRYPAIFEVVFHRVVAISAGSLSGVFVTRMIWPIKARKKLKFGLSMLWVRMALIWKQGPLSVLVDEKSPSSPFSSLSSQTDLRQYVDILDSIRKNAESEFKLKGPFLTQQYDNLLKSTGRMLDSFAALDAVIKKETKATAGEAVVLAWTSKEREQLAKRICHLLSVLASSLSLEYSIATDALPNVSHTRDRLLAKIYEFRLKQDKTVVPTDDDYEILYAYSLVTAQIAKEIEISRKEIETLYGVLDPDNLTLQ